MIKKINLPTNITCIFDLNKSGCQLTWSYFFDEEPPWVINYPWWLWNLPKSRELYAFFDFLNLQN